MCMLWVVCDFLIFLLAVPYYDYQHLNPVVLSFSAYQCVLLLHLNLALIQLLLHGVLVAAARPLALLLALHLALLPLPLLQEGRVVVFSCRYVGP